MTFRKSHPEHVELAVQIWLKFNIAQHYGWFASAVSRQHSETQFFEIPFPVHVSRLRSTRQKFRPRDSRRDRRHVKISGRQDAVQRLGSSEAALDDKFSDQFMAVASKAGEIERDD